MYRVIECHREIYRTQGHDTPPRYDVVEGGLQCVQLPYVHVELAESILIKDVDVVASVHEDLRHPHVLDDHSYHQRELAHLN